MYDREIIEAINILRDMLGMGTVTLDDIRAARVDLQLEMAQDFATIERGDAFHADGRCRCPICQEPYSKHRESFAFPYLNRLCTGELVKL